MKTRTRLTIILDRLLDVEQLAADLYEHYATTFAHISEARDLFVKMKNEEINHKNQVHMQKRILNQAHSAHSVLDVDLEGIDNMVRSVKSQIAQKDVSLIEALDYAILLETDSFEAVYRTAIAKHSPELAQLVRLLTAGDSHHVKQLKDCRASFANRPF